MNYWKLKRKRFWERVCWATTGIIIILFFANCSIDLNPRSRCFSEVDDDDSYRFEPSSNRSTWRTSNSCYTVEDLVQMTDLSKTPVLIAKEKELNLSSFPTNEIHLITQWYHETNLRRRYEIVTVLHMNAINDAISSIHFVQHSDLCTVFDDVIIDRNFPSKLLKSKLVISYRKGFNATDRLTFSEALSYANKAITTGYAMMLNLDIFFDRSLRFLKSMPILDYRQVFYLSRHDVDQTINKKSTQCANENYGGSHDVLIFRPPLSTKVIRQLPYEFGTWNVEMKIIFELLRAKYTVRNVCKSIRPWHLHPSQVRHRLMPGKAFVSDAELHLVMRFPEYL